MLKFSLLAALHKRCIGTHTLCFALLFAALSANAGLPDFADLIEEVSPAVVKINTVQKSEPARASRSPFGSDQLPEMFREFFERAQPQQRSRPAVSLGSGFVISSDGYILTNHHVVEGAEEIVVRFADRDEYSASVVGSDRRSDLALLKIDAQGLPTLKFADSEALRVGEWVVAIGSPFGLDYSATAGIVSAKGRSLPTERGENYVPFIQTDVAINPGNSGGPLFNLDGEVVGINSQIYSRSGGSIGLSFSIPAQVAQEVVAQLKEDGTVERGWLGVVMQDIDSDLAQSLGLDKPRGALINAVEPDGPADRGGIQPGDVIVEFAGKPIVESGDLPHVVGLTRPGKEVDVELYRQGKKRSLSVEVGSLDSDDQRAARRDGTDRLGLLVNDLEPRQLRALQLRGGVVIAEVAENSPAQTAGLRPGDIIVRLGYSQLLDVEEYDLAVAEAPEQSPVYLVFYRQGRAISRTIVID